MKDSEILRIMSRKIFPFLLLFGLYLISYGHISPGGGFQGGVVIGASVILFSLCHGMEITDRRLLSSFSERPEFIMMFAIIGIGLIGVLVKGFFLGNLTSTTWTEPLPRAGTILLLDIAIGLKVGAGMTALFYHMVKQEEVVE